MALRYYTNHNFKESSRTLRGTFDASISSSPLESSAVSYRRVPLHVRSIGFDGWNNALPIASAIKVISERRFRRASEIAHRGQR